MLLNEMFGSESSEDAAKNNIDWASDLKFFIDNNDNMLNQFIFPTVRKHKNYVGNPNVYKLYMSPIKQCLKCYIDKYNIDNVKEKFTADILEKLARHIADVQEKNIKDNHYWKHS